ncbi:MAG: dipeptide ABC transporter ATP-binding protein [Candidatus Rifleibacteriota bacterium]
MAKSKKTKTLLEVKDLKMYFPVLGGVFKRKVADVKAIDGISFTLNEGETLGLVGESGCGKSTTGKCIINLYKPTDGQILFNSKLTGEIPVVSVREGNCSVKVPAFTVPTSLTVDIAKLDNNQMRPFRSEIQMIFQDPYASLNPRMTVRDIIMEPMTIHEPDLTLEQYQEKVDWLMEKVGLSAEQALRYPHEFSGGQRQRIGIARALATNPRLVIADEPVSALDVSIQAQVINLMQDLQDEFGLTYIFIAHDLAVVEHISDRIAVMYLGNIVEIAEAEELFQNPRHPYTRALLSAIPRPDPVNRREKRIVLEGDVPTPLRKPSGCGFRTRCPIARTECAEAPPPALEISPGHLVACPYHDSYRKN